MADDTLRWSVVGVGTAGRARARAIVADPRAQLVAVWRGRHAQELGVRVVEDLDDAIEAAQVVAVCSPNDLHADQIRRALLADRHVLVEYPIAPTAGEAESLFALARSRSLLLHVEHIELLDAAGKTLRSNVRPEVLRSVAISFRGVGAEGASAAHLALSNVARLHRLVALAGPVESVTAVEHQPGRLSAELTMANRVVATCLFEQAPYFQRRTVLEARTGGATWIQQNDLLHKDGVPQTLLGFGELFPKDQRTATARLLDGAPHYVSEDRILHVLDLVERLGACNAGPVPQRSDAAGSMNAAPLFFR